MQKTILAESEIDERRLDPGHHLGDAAKVDVTDHFLLLWVLDEDFSQSAIFGNCDARLVCRRIDNDLFLHGVRLYLPFPPEYRSGRVH